MELREKIRNLPKKPGVYLFKDTSAKIIYIGKAKCLRERVSNYFSGHHADPKTARLVANIADLEFYIVDNEVEALVLEATLIRQHKPHYNVRLKDDKRFPYIHITDEPYPRIEIERRRTTSGQYFGPYVDGLARRMVMDLIKEYFHLRSCKHPLPQRKPVRACLNYDIGRCDAPCQEYITVENYRERIEEVILLLKGKHSELLKRLTNRMNVASTEMDFEHAAKLRDQIAAIERLWLKQKIDTDLADRDLQAIAIGPKDAVAVTMQVREGRVIARQEFHMAVALGTSKQEAMSGYLTQYYSDNPNPPNEILVSVEPQDAEEIADFVSVQRGAKVDLRKPQRGQKRELIELVERNAELLLAEIVHEKSKVNLPFAVIELEKELKLKKPPRTIEAVDISHLGGTNAVASLVTFRDGKKFGRGYRRYKIKTAEGGDDYASIYEVVSRRLQRLSDEEKGFPDLLLIDGGKGQLAFAEKAVIEVGAEGEVELASIAKRLEEIFRPQFERSLMLPKDSAALRLLMRIRDEAHRFAVEYQRKRRTKAFQASELATVPGIGPKRQKKLLTEFESLEEIANSSPEVVAKAGNIPLELATKLLEEISHYKTLLFLFVFGASIFFGCTPSPRYIGQAKPEMRPTRHSAVSDTTRVAKPSTAKPSTQKPTTVRTTTAATGAVFDSEALLGAINLYIGTPYKYGGTGFTGVDCSGFVHDAFGQAGVQLPRTSREQFKVGQSVSRPEFGDLVFFRMRGKEVDHVGISLGNKKFAHASSTQGVTISSLDDPYYKARFLGARRID
jgi:excinuclease ABC subunit C